MASFARACAAIGVGLSLTFAFPLNASANAGSDRVRVITHNIAGASINGGAAQALNAVNAEIADMNPHVVMLQEVCGSQYRQFVADHPGWKVGLSGRRPNANCPVDPQFGRFIGDLIASPMATAGQPQAYALPSPVAGTDFWLTCMDIPTTHAPILACGTHLVADGENVNNARQAQAQAIKDITQGTINAGRSVIVAGDFNSAPRNADLDPIYRINRVTGAPDGPGNFWESDQADKTYWTSACNNAARSYCRSGQGTHGSDPNNRNERFDYIFMSQNQTNAADLVSPAGFSTVVPVPISRSDHSIVKAGFDVY